MISWHALLPGSKIRSRNQGDLAEALSQTYEGRLFSRPSYVEAPAPAGWEARPVEAGVVNALGRRFSGVQQPS